MKLCLGRSPWTPPTTTAQEHPSLVTSLYTPHEPRSYGVSIIGSAGRIDQPLCTLATGNIINSVWDLLIALVRNSKQPNLELHF